MVQTIAMLIPCFAASSLAPCGRLALSNVRPRFASKHTTRIPLVPTLAQSFSMKGGGTKTKTKTATRIPYIQIDDPASESWKLGPAIDILRDGGLGVIPTDTCYMFMTPVDSRNGIQRIYEVKEVESYKNKPLTLLCKDISQISLYTTALNLKSTFKMLKALLPGPYTFIFSATNDLPRMVLEHKNRSKKTWKRQEIGVRIPANEVCHEIIEQLGKPLLCAGVPRNGDVVSTAVGAQDNYAKFIDFVVDAGPREEVFSTVVDMASDEPTVIREGSGSLDDLAEFIDI